MNCWFLCKNCTVRRRPRVVRAFCFSLKIFLWLKLILKGVFWITVGFKCDISFNCFRYPSQPRIFISLLHKYPLLLQGGVSSYSNYRSSRVLIKESCFFTFPVLRSHLSVHNSGFDLAFISARLGRSQYGRRLMATLGYFVFFAADRLPHAVFRVVSECRITSTTVAWKSVF